jgi:hypothetical protein
MVAVCTGLRQARASRGARVGAAQARARPPEKSAEAEEPNETSIGIVKTTPRMEQMITMICL